MPHKAQHSSTRIHSGQLKSHRSVHTLNTTIQCILQAASSVKARASCRRHRSELRSKTASCYQSTCLPLNSEEKRTSIKRRSPVLNMDFELGIFGQQLCRSKNTSRSPCGRVNVLLKLLQQWVNSASIRHHPHIQIIVCESVTSTSHGGNNHVHRIAKYPTSQTSEEDSA